MYIYFNVIASDAASMILKIILFLLVCVLRKTTRIYKKTYISGADLILIFQKKITLDLGKKFCSINYLHLN